ncbi:hypothetical protein H6F96_19510 [Microcoleus sp. FACHB-53]|nr:hypothetical protein [Microcoleus sp. FACHB-53]
MDVQTIGASVTTTTGVEKDSVLDELSSSSNFAQNTQREKVTALDNPSNKSSNLDKLLMEEAVEKQLDEVQHAQPVTKTQESISPASRAIAPSPAATEPVAITKSGEAIASSPAPAVIDSQLSHATRRPCGGAESPGFDREQESDRVDEALDGLGWSIDQIRDCLISNYKKKSRKYLSDAELLDFLTHLEAQSAAAAQSDPMSSEEAIADLAELLEICDSKECFAELASTAAYSPTVIKKACNLLPSDKKRQIKEWIDLINQGEKQAIAFLVRFCLS